jgi:4-hydroxy-4-methyl-2-oxoglutarate aldolase
LSGAASLLTVDLSPRFAALYAAAVTDVLDSLGLQRQTLPPEIRPLREGMRLAGPAFAVAGRPRPGMAYKTSIRRILELLGAIPAGHVAVYATEDRESAHFGELSATALKSRRVAGVVLDGGCRDVEFIAREGFPVFARYTTPQDCVPRWEVLGWGGEVTVADVRVVTGDYVVGDADGVAVVPAASAEEVLTRAEAIVSTENLVREAVRSGMAPLDAFERYGKF